ncbi:hypothetical protein BB560_006002 [Smittium megazygosporum]|uniref:Uncharacterized protein n=1 Tax=Smittium megazygosporum TaxID=133381 RepID=A0A2T9YLV5_9FUNG|nr:hypothetical protein BB560_006002 [Smittium megazygosporum]
MDAAGVKRFKCVAGYLGLDCKIPDSATLYKISCYLKGKPGYYKGGVSVNNDLDNKGISCKESTVTSVVPTATTAYTTLTTSTAITTSTGYTTSTAYATSTPYTTPTTSTAYTTPTTPAAPVACPLIVDIQKCMNKCVDDVLN